MTEAILQKMQRLASVSATPGTTALQADKLLRQHRRPPARVRRSRADGIGDARKHGADDAAALALHVNKISISAPIEGRGAQEMVG
jgi:hypothetical protein